MSIDNRTVYSKNGVTVEVTLENCFSDLPPSHTAVAVSVRLADEPQPLAETEGTTNAAHLCDAYDTRPVRGCVKEALAYAAKNAAYGAQRTAVEAALAWATEQHGQA